ncbi:MAG: carboxypeptidase-like regulatory domain-containing protein, partial [Gemmatimonadaceae bacterium]
MQAQAVPGEVRVRLVTAGGSPVVGALVGLLDASGGLAAEGISSESGGRTLRAPAGSYRIRVRRIGFRPFISAPTSIPHPNELVLRIESEAIALKSVVVMAESRCQRIDRDLEAVGVVWEEIAKALNSSQLTSDDLAGVG